APAIPCSLAVLSSLASLPRPHAGHKWEPQPGMTPVHCPGAGDVRRARYAQEIHAAGPLAVNGPETIADAVMAVADEEIAEALRVSDAATSAMLEERRNENQRLRVEMKKDAAITKEVMDRADEDMEGA
ncbi:hypothetical protein, partial [Streptomyces sp. NPDC058418]|uniref:hypothetical protein n=1 Tax=Streptomyces sp. NPDC058418 TaxID=3346488 RepID=UPI0036545CEC